jgi:hypothetical protein
MKKIIAFFAIITLMTFGTAFAMEKIKISPSVYQGIKKYKQQNYSGCIQDMQTALVTEADKSLPYYYIGNSYVKLGMSAEAVKNYNEVITLKTSPGLVLYSQQAVACLNDKTKCSGEDDLNAFINSKKFMHPEVIKSLEEQQVDQARAEINASGATKEKQIDFDKYKYINDASQEMPTNEEIANAVKILAKIGYNPYAQSAINPAFAQTYSPQYSQMNAVVGQTSTGGNAFNAMLPYLIAQTNNSQNRQNDQNQQLMQTMMLNQMSVGF